ncbi:NAD(P)-dependent alcohol dehydrogenase [Candidatus Micrarchaeota archaeon]|nr:NAD(P)-dependent alcohol dehydrogenase [Candidatus Micrarchaeota archaeon]
MVKAYAAQNKDAPLAPMEIRRRELGPSDVSIAIRYCGICHSDLHKARDEWGVTQYPIVPGHEIVGQIEATGSAVGKFKTGDWVGIGCLIDSCLTCQSCKNGQEQHCEKGATYTYNSPDIHLGGMTYGGYSEKIIVDEAFVLRIPKELDPAAAAPLLCAGITIYSPMVRWNVKKGEKVGVAGIGGLGHVAVKIAKALGSHVTAITTSESKAQAARILGADDSLISNDADAMAKNVQTLDVIIDSIPASHDVDALLQLLKRDGVLVLVGLPAEPLQVFAKTLARKSRILTGSQIGGITQTQEMLDFCAAHGIVADVEIIPIQKINEAYARMKKGDVHYRFVIDMASLKESNKKSTAR